MARARIAAAVICSLFIAALPPGSAAAVSAGARCTKVNRVVTTGSGRLTCTRIKGKLVWVRAPIVKPSAPITNPTELTPLRTGSCSALAPSTWALVPNSDASAADLISPDRTRVASWGMIVVPAVVGGFGTLPPYNHRDAYSEDPAIALRHYLRYYESAENPAADLAYTTDPPEVFDNYTARTMRSSKHTLIALYTAFPGDGWSSRYILVVRLAKATNAMWKRFGGEVAHYALSISCVTRLNPEGNRIPDPASRKSPTRQEADEDAGYNPWLGTEYVHNPATGTNYTVGVDDWSRTGPQGPGYYTRSGNDWVKLTAGRSPNG